jgi:hypothetical protein
MIGRDEIRRMKSERNTVFIALLFASAMILVAVLLVWKGQITGYQALDTFESDVLVTGSSPDNSLSFERIPNFRARVGEHVSFRVLPNQEGITFSDNSRLFEISQEGVVDFTAHKDDVGRHNVWIIINDAQQHYYYQNVAIIIED